MDLQHLSRSETWDASSSESRIKAPASYVFSKIAAVRSDSFMASETFLPHNSVQDTEVTNSGLKICTINQALQWLHEVVAGFRKPEFKTLLITRVETSCTFSTFCLQLFGFAITYLKEETVRPLKLLKSCRLTTIFIKP